MPSVPVKALKPAATTLPLTDGGLWGQVYIIIKSGLETKEYFVKTLFESYDSLF